MSRSKWRTNIKHFSGVKKRRRRKKKTARRLGDQYVCVKTNHVYWWSVGQNFCAKFLSPKPVTASGCTNQRKARLKNKGVDHPDKLDIYWNPLLKKSENHLMCNSVGGISKTLVDDVIFNFADKRRYFFECFSVLECTIFNV